MNSANWKILWNLDLPLLMKKKLSIFQENKSKLRTISIYLLWHAIV